MIDLPHWSVSGVTSQYLVGPAALSVPRCESDQADLAVFSLAFTYGRSKVALCPPAVAYQPYYFYSRYPQKTTMLWNLKNLLTPGSWFMYFLTIICIILYLKLSFYVGRKLGLNTVTEEITLVPFRC